MSWDSATPSHVQSYRFSEPPMNLTVMANPPEWMSQFYSAIGIVAFAVNGIAAYCILKKSTKEMGIYKWFLLNIWFWSFFLDLQVVFFYQPYSLFPLVGSASITTYMKGWLTEIQYAFTAACFMCVINCNMAYVSAILYRWQVLLPDSKILKSKFILLTTLTVLHGIYQCPGLLVIYLMKPNRYMREFVAYHVINYEELREKVFVVFSPDICSTYYYGVGLFSFGLPILLFVCVLMLLDSYRRLFVVKSTLLSAKATSLNKQMLISLTMQIFIPLSCYTTPLGFAMLVSLAGVTTEQMQKHIPLIIACFCFHSILNSVVMIGTISHYRAGMLRLFCACERARVEDSRSGPFEMESRNVMTPVGGDRSYISLREGTAKRR